MGSGGIIGRRIGRVRIWISHCCCRGARRSFAAVVRFAPEDHKGIPRRRDEQLEREGSRGLRCMEVVAGVGAQARREAEAGAAGRGAFETLRLFSFSPSTLLAEAGITDVSPEGYAIYCDERSAVDIVPPAGAVQAWPTTCRIESKSTQMHAN